LTSLDAFRGFTIAAMILVNNPGSWDDVYTPLVHADWNGWTLADLVFPFFLFIVGVAITFSFGTARGGRRLARDRLKRILHRTALLFAIGIMLNTVEGFAGLGTLRIPGVLQRIALCYLVASVVFLATGPALQAAMMAALLAGYGLILALVPVEGHRPGWLDPDHNPAAYLDRMLLGEGHLYHPTWDPEGVLSTIPAIATTLSGVLAGHWLRSKRGGRQTTLGLAVAGIAATVAGLFLDRWMPINKNLWTSSYAVFTSGCALLSLAACHWLVDVKGYRRAALPFVVFGVNPIAVYVLSMAGGALLDVVTLGGDNLRTIVLQSLFGGWAPPRAASFLFAVSYVLAWLGAMSVLYRKKVFIKI
jgi:predicted acyltransferase